MKFIRAFFSLWVALRSISGATFTDDFASLPTAWLEHNGGAVVWDAEAKNLRVTWDSRETNSFFYFQLPWTLTRSESFSAEFTLRLDDLMLGADPAKANTFPLAVGFLNFTQATRTNYYRGAGTSAANGPRGVVEFSYFPDGGLDATIAPIIASTNNQIAVSHTHPVELAAGEIYRIRFGFDAATQQLTTAIWLNGEPYGEPPDGTIRPLNYPTSFGDFAVDIFSIHSYSHAGQTPPQFAGSLLAHGTIDDVVITWPEAPISRIAGRWQDGAWVVSFVARFGWTYNLLRATEVSGAWDEVTSLVGRDGWMELRDEAPVVGSAFYKVSANRP